MRYNLTTALLWCSAITAVVGKNVNPFADDDDDDDVPAQQPISTGGGNANASPVTPGTGNKNPFGSDDDDSLNAVLLDTGGCPATRAVAPTGKLQHASSPICPDGDGKLYQSPDGATFYIQCCTHGAATTIKEVVTQDFRSCMNLCSQTEDCNSVQFVAFDKPGVPEPYHTCKLSKDGGFSSGVCGATDMHSYASLVDPPPIEVMDSASVMCSTECPFANGQQFVSKSGEVFHMDCGMRHGTTVIFRDHQENFKSCVQSCGQLLACHSVDYDAKRSICYYGQHHGEPTIKAPGFISAHSMGCAGACSSGGGCGSTSGNHEYTSPVNPNFASNAPFPQDAALGNVGGTEPICSPGDSSTKYMMLAGKRWRAVCNAASICDGTTDIITNIPWTQARSLEECTAHCIDNMPECKTINFFTDGKPDGSAGRCVVRRCSDEPTLGQDGIVALYPA